MSCYCENKSIILIDFELKKEIHNINGFNLPINDMGFCLNNKYFAYGGDDKFLRIHDLEKD